MWTSGFDRTTCTFSKAQLRKEVDGPGAFRTRSTYTPMTKLAYFPGSELLVAATNVGSSGGDLSQAVSVSGIAGDGTQFAMPWLRCCVTVNGG